MKFIRKLLCGITAISLATSYISLDGFATDNIVQGQIIMEDGSPVAGVKVDIYSSTLDTVYDEGVSGYSHTYYSSSVTDSNGIYEFSKPSLCYFINVDLDTLPTRTGIDKQNEFIMPNENVKPFTIYDINKVEYTNSKEIFILNEAGERIAANYTIDNSTNRINTENIALMDSSFSTSICNANGVEVTINNNHDMSEYSPFEKADYLFNEGIIDEETKIFTYLQAIEIGDCGDIECATEIYDTINRYSAENPGTKI